MLRCRPTVAALALVLPAQARPISWHAAAPAGASGSRRKRRVRGEPRAASSDDRGLQTLLGRPRPQRPQPWAREARRARARTRCVFMSTCRARIARCCTSSQQLVGCPGRASDVTRAVLVAGALSHRRSATQRLLKTTASLSLRDLGVRGSQRSTRRLQRLRRCSASCGAAGRRGPAARALSLRRHARAHSFRRTCVSGQGVRRLACVVSEAARM